MESIWHQSFVCWGVILPKCWWKNCQAESGQKLRLPGARKRLEKGRICHHPSYPALQPLEECVCAIGIINEACIISCIVPGVYPNLLLIGEPKPFSIVVICSSCRKCFFPIIELFLGYAIVTRCTECGWYIILGERWYCFCNICFQRFQNCICHFIELKSDMCDDPEQPKAAGGRLQMGGIRYRLKCSIRVNIFDASHVIGNGLMARASTVTDWRVRTPICRSSPYQLSIQNHNDSLKAHSTNMTSTGNVHFFVLTAHSRNASQVTAAPTRHHFFFGGVCGVSSSNSMVFSSVGLSD